MKFHTPIYSGRRKNCRSGFTLLELILVSAIAILILGELGLVFHFVSRQYSNISAQSYESWIQQIAAESINRDISMLAAGADADKPVILSNIPNANTADSFDWLRLICAGQLSSDSSAVLIDYFVYPGEDENLLVRRSQKLNSLPVSGFSALSAQNDAGYEVVISQVDEFTLSFYDSDGSLRGDWPRELAPQIPQAVEITLGLVAEDGKRVSQTHFFVPLRGLEAAVIPDVEAKP